MSRQQTALKYIYEQRNETEDRIKLGIEQNRKGFAELKITDENGNVLKGAEITAELKKHEFKHGANIFMLDELESEEKNEAYKQSFSRQFNLATLPFYWKDIEPEPGKLRFNKNSPKVYRRPAPDLCLEFCDANNIEPKLHCLNYMQWTPDWVPDDITETKKLLEKRFKEIAEKYADKIPSVEVINETLLWNTRRFFRYPELVEWSFKTAEKYFPNNELIINEAGLIYDHWCHGNRLPYYMLIERALEKGARIDSIGIQAHMFYKSEDEAEKVAESANPERLFRILDDLAEFKKPLQITEITIPAYTNAPEDEAVQAELLRWLYSIYFSHASVEAAIYWNLVDGYAAFAPLGDMTKGENYFHGGLLRFDMSEKPAYKTLYSLFHKEWHTKEKMVSDEAGKAIFKGFYGDYELRITYNGKVFNKDISLQKNGNKSFEIVLR